LKYLLPELPEHLIITGRLCDLYHPANLPTVDNINGEITTPIGFY
jgi:hypothetical protein